MGLTINASSQEYLTNLDRTLTQMQKAQEQVSSGLRLQQASDDPSAVASIFELQSRIAQNQQTQSNLGSVQTELNSADSSLQSAITNVQNALSLATQGATSSATAAERTNLASQVGSILQNLVGISQTQVNGQYIFSGDQPSQPMYQLDPTQPNGVRELLTATATRVITDVNGTSIAIAKTAQDIFDARDAQGNPQPGAVFTAVNSLMTALQNNDQTGITQAISSLHTADDHLNQSLAFYGNAEDRVTGATALAQKFLLQNQSDLSAKQDADIPAAALALTKAQTQQQATLAVEAKIQQIPNLFSLLG